MREFLQDLHRQLSSFQRLLRARGGSVLILVVALIVILALLGTAFVATARIDRFAATASITTTSIVPELQSLQTEICGDIAAGLFDTSVTPNTYRPYYNDPTKTAAALSGHYYGHWDTNHFLTGDIQEWDTWLADRLPALSGTAAPYNISWRSLSRLPDKTFVNLLLVSGGGGLTSVKYDPWGKTPGDIPTYVVPTAIALTYSRSANETTPNTPKVFPALYLVNAATGAFLMPDGVTASVTPAPFLAADADGDGIADSLLFDLGLTTPSPQGSVSYYAAVRIIDNNSAVNVNTAWSRTSDFSFAIPPSQPTPTAVDAIGGPTTPAGNLGWFPSHVGLLEMLDPNSQTPFASGATAPFEMAWLNSYRFNLGGSVSTITSTPTEAGVARTDYTFLTLGDALYNQLGRRLENPATVTSGSSTTYQSVADSGELQFRFNMVDPNANSSPSFNYLFASTTAEQRLPRSAYYDTINWVQDWTDNRWLLYPADKAVYWYDYNFNTDNTAVAGGINTSLDNEGPAASSILTTLAPAFYRNLRSLAVTRNPVSNAAPMHLFAPPGPPPAGLPLPVTAPAAGAVATYMATYPASPGMFIKASLNTDPFEVLWRAFWNVMCDDNDPTSIPVTPGTAIAYPAVNQIYTPPPDIATAGGATAATINTTVTSLHWPRYDQMLIRAAVAAANVEALRDPSQNVTSHHLILPDGVNIEVFGNKPQPYVFSFDADTAGAPPKPKMILANPMNATVTLNGCQFVYYDPATPTTAPILLTTDLPPSPLPATPGSYTISIAGRSQSPTVNITGLPAAVTATAQILLMRSRLATGAPSAVATGVDVYNEASTTYWDLIPIDYVLATQPFVTPRGTGAGAPTIDWSVVQAILNPAGAPVNPNLTQIFNDDFGGPYGLGSPTNPSATTGKFPFGAFARIGDVLKVPFIGSYRVIVPSTMTTATVPLTPAATFTAGTLNSTVLAGGAAPTFFVPVSMDAAACWTAEAGEQIGHFCPLTTDPTVAAGLADYDWAKKIFDYFTTIQNPASDYSPNVFPGSSTTPTTWANPTTGFPLSPVPTPIANTANVPKASVNAAENADGVDGLININTAPWQVLAALPMVTAGQDNDHVGGEDNVQLAKAIVLYRDGDGTPSHPAHGPFKSIFELNNVVDPAGTGNGFQNGWGALFSGTTIAAFDSTSGQGDFSPVTTGQTDNSPGDWEKKYLTLTKISNLITTRSDTFTCYIVVQAWLNAGTNPQMIAQQRIAFIANRVGTTVNSSNAVQTTNINYTSQ